LSLIVPVVCGKDERTVSTLHHDPKPMPATSRITNPMTMRRVRRDFFLTGIDVLRGAGWTDCWLTP
jgi:hypothetical protein